MARELSDKAKPAYVEYKGKTVVPLSGDYAFLSGMIREVVKKVGLHSDEEFEYIFRVEKKQPENIDTN